MEHQQQHLTANVSLNFYLSSKQLFSPLKRQVVYTAKNNFASQWE